MNHQLNHLVVLMVKASALRAADLGSIPAFAVGLFPCRVIPVFQKLVLLSLPCQAPGVTASALGPVGLESVYCDWVR